MATNFTPHVDEFDEFLPFLKVEREDNDNSEKVSEHDAHYYYESSTYDEVDDGDDYDEDSNDDGNNYDSNEDGYDEDNDDDDEDNDYGWSDEDDEEFDDNLESRINEFIAKVINGWREESLW